MYMYMHDVPYYVHPSTCTVVMHVCYAMHHILCSQEAQDMASPAIQLSTRIPDKRLQVWAASLLAGSIIIDAQVTTVHLHVLYLVVSKLSLF